MQTAHSALIIPIPEAEPAVAHHRATLDRAATWGVPAHITLVFPFLPPDQLTPDVITTLTHTIAAHPEQHLTFRRTAWFGDRVLWLAPEPATGLIALTNALTAAFPQAQPYEGAFTDVIPHLTIGHDHPHPDLTKAETETTKHLPLYARTTNVHLIQGLREPGTTWHTTHRFALTAIAGSPTTDGTAPSPS